MLLRVRNGQKCAILTVRILFCSIDYVACVPKLCVHYQTRCLRMEIRGRFWATKEAVDAFVENVSLYDVTFQVYTPTSAFVGSVPDAVLPQRRGTLQLTHKPAGYLPRSSSTQGNRFRRVSAA